MWKLIRYSFTMRRTQSIATLFTVAVTVAVLFALLLTYQGVSLGVRTASERLGADLMVVPAESAADIDQGTLLFTGAPVTMYLSADLLTQISGVPGVAKATPQFYGQTLNKSCCSTSDPARLIGFDASTDWIISSWAGLTEGQKLGEGRIIIGSNVTGFETGKGSLLGNAVTVAAVLEPTGTDLDGSIVMDIDQVRTLSREKEDFADLWKTYGDPDTLVSAVLVKVDDGALDSVKAKLNTLDGVTVIESNTALTSASDQLYSLLRIMVFIVIVMVIASLLQLFARFYSVVWDRRSELALYRALGATKRDLVKLIGGEAGILTGVGLVVGLIVGGALFAIVPGLLAKAGSFPFITPHAGFIILCALCVVVVFAILGFLAILVPLRQSTRISPASAMQTGDID